MPPVTSRKILVVDDCQDSAEMIGMLLESAGHTVSSAQNGPTALLLFERDHPDIVLLDISLPGMTGQEVCAKIRAAEAPPPKAIVAMTGWHRDEIQKSSAGDPGFTHHLLKPIDPGRLVELIENIGR
ncbi:MAG: response regulator [Vicinamibacterales bacterium]